jgi:hypothetical protein
MVSVVGAVGHVVAPNANSGKKTKGLLDAKKIWQNRHCSVFVVIWQLVSNHSLIRIKRFVSWISSKLYN